MATAARIIVGVLLLAHGLVHLLYLVKEPDDPKWPFRMDSWALPASIERNTAIALMSVVAIGFGLLALGVWGTPGLATIWPVLAIGASVVSIVLLALYWDRQLVFGVLISALIVVIAIARPDWATPIGG